MYIAFGSCLSVSCSLLALRNAKNQCCCMGWDRTRAAVLPRNQEGSPSFPGTGVGVLLLGVAETASVPSRCVQRCLPHTREAWHGKGRAH